MSSFLARELIVRQPAVIAWRKELIWPVLMELLGEQGAAAGREALASEIHEHLDWLDDAGQAEFASRIRERL